MIVADLWTLLNAGKRITDGEMVVFYDGGFLLRDDGEALDIIPFNTDNCDEWEAYDEEAATQPLYYRWIVVDKEFIRFSDTFYLDSVTPSEGWERHADGFTKEEIIGSL